MNRGIALLVLLTCAASAFIFGQKVQLPVLTASGEQQTEAQFQSLFGRRVCDSSGSVYVRYFAKGSVFTAPITKIDSGGKTKTIPIGKLPNIKGELCAFAVGTGDKLYEIIRGQSKDSEKIRTYYAEFDHNGSLISRTAFEFEDEFFPSVLVPLPTGDFFASGTLLKRDAEKHKSSEIPVSAIFGPDAKLKRKVRKIDTDSPDVDQKLDATVNGNAVLAEDGRIYVFAASNPVRLTVVSQSGVVERKLSLEAPLQNATPLAMFVSGGRIAISWFGESSDPNDEGRVTLYDAQTGTVMRVYKPEYTGSPVCFENGKTLKILTITKARFFGLASADLQ